MMSRVRPKVVCVFRRGREILVGSVSDSVKGDEFFGPPGGEIEFGEYAAAAVRREMREELGVDVSELELVTVLENVFRYEGAPGHEIIFVFTARFPEESWYELERIPCVEGVAEVLLTWEDLDTFRPGHRRLVPDGLFDLLTARPRQ
jgi:ADP-ribose pyrophosphatase YjhB (NUDIX family)